MIFFRPRYLKMRDAKPFKIETFQIGTKKENILDKKSNHKEDFLNKGGSSSECSNQVRIVCFFF